MTALIGCSFLLLGCGLPIGFSSEGTVTESEQEKMVEWCFENGQIAVPGGPGLGVEVDEKKLEKYRVQ